MNAHFDKASDEDGKCRPVKVALHECIDTAVIYVVMLANAFIGNAKGQLPQSRA